MHPSNLGAEAPWPDAVQAILDRIAKLRTREVLRLAHAYRHVHGPGPCPAAPLPGCRADEVQSSSSIASTALSRAGREADARRLRATIETLLHEAVEPELVRAEGVLGVLDAAASAATFAAIAALVPDRMSTANGSLLAGPWSAALGEAAA